MAATAPNGNQSRTMRTALSASLSWVNARGGRRVWVWCALLAAVALTLDFVPLFDLLGYDFCFAVGMFAAFAASDIGAGVVRAAWRADGNTASVFALAGRAIALSTAILVAPLLLSLANALRVRNCNVAAGLAFFLLLPMATAVFASVSGTLAGLAGGRRGRLVAWLLPIGSLLWTLLRLYVDPPVFAYDPFGGYFPGPIYDEALRPPETLWLFRGVNLVWASAALCTAAALWRTPAGGGPARLSRNWRQWHRRTGVVAILLIAVSVVLFAARGRLGFHTTREDLARVLDGERRTPRVVLRYATDSGATSAQIDLLMEDLSFRYDQLRATLGVEPETAITIYQFTSTDQKKRLVGAGHTLYARPWSREIFVQMEGFPARRLRHEMAHVFAGAFGDRWFGVSLHVRFWGPIPVPRLASGLIEGVAEAADFSDPIGGSTTHQEAAAIIADGRAPRLEAVVGAGFTTLSGPRAYTLAGSFCRYLLDTRGAQKLRDLYRSAGDFAAVYGEPLDALEAEWRRFLASQPLSAEQRARAREEFRRPAIFKKVCAREQAARLSEARALQGTAPQKAVAIVEQACRDDPGEPTLRIALAEAQLAAGAAEKALALLASVEESGDVTAPVRAHAATLAASIHFHAGDIPRTREALRRVLAAATSDAERRLAQAKLRAIEGEAAQRTLGRALFGDSVTAAADPVLTFYLLAEFARLYPDDALGPYLVGRQLADRDPRLALRHLRTACEAPSSPKMGDPSAQPLPSDFTRECLRLTTLAAYRAGDLEVARAAAVALEAASAEQAEKMRAADLVARIDWKRASR